jgi:D-alanyl-D-alanine carboxypeptidase
MPKSHILKKGETLTAVAELRLGDRKLAKALADFNGLASARDVTVGQAIAIPSKRELVPPKRKAGARSGVMPWPAPPHGFEAIKETFGDPASFVRDDGTEDPRWQAQHIVRVPLPYPIPYDSKQMLTKLACHKLVAPLFAAVFTDIANKGLKSSVKSCAGVFNWRMKRGQAKPSTHTWAIAIDLNAPTNAMGTPGDMDPRLVELFESYGFVWGGRWSGANKDPMHFQYCSGY